MPPPLSKDEEEKYLTLLSENSSEAKSALIEHNLRLVVYIAKKFENTGINIEDLISIGTIGLIKAINTFNPKKNMQIIPKIFLRLSAYHSIRFPFSFPATTPSFPAHNLFPAVFHSGHLQSGSANLLRRVLQPSHIPVYVPQNILLR